MHSAYLILAHKNPGQLQRLISRLSTDHTEFFVHLDQKVEDRQLYARLADGLKHVHFIRRQVPVHWGAFSMVEATLNGLSEILEYDRSVDYIHLLSGMDYPLKSNETLYNFFSRNRGREFICCRETPSPELPLGGTDRFEYYYNYDNAVDSPIAYETEMKQRGIKRTFPEGLRPYHGSQWWSLTGSCAGYILNYLEENLELINYYRYTKFPDEQFFQTLVMNSGFAGNVAQDNQRHIDWMTTDWAVVDWNIIQPHPKTFTLVDFAQLKKSPKLFARKFDETIDPYILNNIDNLLLHYRPASIRLNTRIQV